MRTEPDVEVLVESQRPATPEGHVVLLHGLEGSGKAGYMRSMSASALAAGYAATPLPYAKLRRDREPL